MAISVLGLSSAVVRLLRRRCFFHLLQLVMIRQNGFGVANGRDEVTRQSDQSRAQAREKHQQSHPGAESGTDDTTKYACQATLCFQAGSSKKSANVPAMMGEIGWVNQAIRRRAEKTRPCTSGATLDCQMA